jgi:uncharacterized protein
VTRSGRDRDPAVTRDRDLAGRPRSARPRDELGRPLPRTVGSDVPRIPDDLTVTGAEAAAMGGELLAEGRPFHAHEVFEAAWKTGSEAERDLWQGLAQVAVGLTHARRGNARGAVTLLRRGAQRVRGYAPPAGQPHGIDTAFVIAQAEDLATRIERDGLPAIPAADLLLPLQAPTSLTCVTAAR